MCCNKPGGVDEGEDEGATGTDQAGDRENDSELEWLPYIKGKRLITGKWRTPAFAVFPHSSAIHRLNGLKFWGSLVHI